MFGTALQGSMRSSYLSPSPPISGRDISALAVIRRPSWSGAARTASYDGGSATAAGTQVSLTPHLSASLHDRVLYGALGPTAKQEHAGASPVFPIRYDRLEQYVAVGGVTTAQITNALSFAHAFQLYISSDDCSAQTLSLDSGSIGYISIYGLRLELCSVAAIPHKAAMNRRSEIKM